MELLSQYNFTEVLVFIMLGLLFFKETLLSLLKKRFGREDAVTEENTPEWAAKLQLHYNEETTQELKGIREKLGDMHDCLKRANTSLDTMKEYGVKVRKNI